jgi:hypothetical protein
VTEPKCPTEIYFVTGIHAKGRLYHNTGPLRLSIAGHAGRCRNAKGVKVYKLEPPGWFDVTDRFLTEEGYAKW